MNKLPVISLILADRRQKKFFTLVEQGEVEKVAALIEKGESVNQSRKLHPTLSLLQSPLFCAINSSSGRKWEMAQLLLSKGADPNGMGAMQTPFQSCLNLVRGHRMRLSPDTPYDSAPELRLAVQMYVQGGDANHPAPGEVVQTTGSFNPNAHADIDRDIALWLETQKVHFLATELDQGSPKASAISQGARL